MVKIIAWGSLLWDPRELEMGSGWRHDGPTLPIEFSRIARDGRLTLVVDPADGAAVTTWTCDSSLDLQDAVQNLSLRERCSADRIGWVDTRTGKASPHRPATVRGIRTWCSAAGAKAAVWTALPKTFGPRSGTPFSIPNALAYLGGLTGTVRARAFEYIRRAPLTTMTAVRRSFQARWPEDP